MEYQLMWLNDPLQGARPRGGFNKLHQEVHMGDTEYQRTLAAGLSQ